MTSISSSAAPSSSASCTTADFTQWPSTDVSCAVGSTRGLPSNTTDILSMCCKSAPVEDFNGSCGHYCLSVDQSVEELRTCFMDQGMDPSAIFCNANNTAEATGTPSQSGGASKTGGSGADATGGSEGDEEGVAAAVGVSKMGLGMLGMVLVSALTGALF